jgi:hypothetical protein
MIVNGLLQRNISFQLVEIYLLTPDSNKTLLNTVNMQ